MTIYSVCVFQYLADANEAEAWMKEKEPIAGGQDYGKDEDSSEALLKKHEAMITDLEAFQATVESLRQQANQCSVSYQRVMGSLTRPRIMWIIV